MPKERNKIGEQIASPESVAEDNDTGHLQDLISSLFLSPRYSDLTIICGDIIFTAHRNIVCLQSEFFQRACDGNFKENQGKIELIDQNPILVEKMLQFLYTGDYTFEEPEPPSITALGTSLRTSGRHMDSHTAIFHAQMYAQGDYFLIDRLQVKAKQYFVASFIRNQNSSSFTSTIVEVYTSTAGVNRGLRDVVVELVKDNLTTLRGSAFPILNNNLLTRVPDFAHDLCVSLLDQSVGRTMRPGSLFGSFNGH
ncbi:BTB/POZ domain-containing protein [Aspergillus alliaceus]|uniref:BTB/POZ domain-containing protein n=1 Tax=Petromyces alliaceus TaxID=209559 RepID=UPI0012A6CFB4|nr:BTB/POZ domain protein [Aspergillus alliaceus]KAB8228866.1 BTB/POZ domain protein [Aspergillus alliaceus]